MEIVVKANIRAIRLFLAKLSDDERLDKREQWLAEQSLGLLNEFSDTIDKLSAKKDEDNA